LAEFSRYSEDSIGLQADRDPIVLLITFFGIPHTSFHAIEVLLRCQNFKIRDFSSCSPGGQNFIRCHI